MDQSRNFPENPSYICSTRELIKGSLSGTFSLIKGGIRSIFSQFFYFLF